jgi:hypothetical protein
MIMRTFLVLRVLAVAAALSAPIAQAAFADQQEQQAKVQTDNGSAGFDVGGPYSTSHLSPTVGD